MFLLDWLKNGVSWILLQFHSLLSTFMDPAGGWTWVLSIVGLVIVILQLLGAIGLLVGLRYGPILTFASLGLALLMFAGVVVRIISKDSIQSSLQALFFMGLNAYIFWASMALWP